MANPSIPNTSTGFLSLPTELRLHIYSFAFNTHQHHTQGFIRGGKAQHPRRPYRNISLLRVCQQIYQEAHQVLYSETTFIVILFASIHEALLAHANALSFLSAAKHLEVLLIAPMNGRDDCREYVLALQNLVSLAGERDDLLSLRILFHAFPGSGTCASLLMGLEGLCVNGGLHIYNLQEGKHWEDYLGGESQTVLQSHHGVSKYRQFYHKAFDEVREVTVPIKDFEFNESGPGEQPWQWPFGAWLPEYGLEGSSVTVDTIRTRRINTGN